MVEDVATEAVTPEAVVTPLISSSAPVAAPAPPLARVTR